MTKVRGRFVDGKVILEGPPPDWENGLELDIGPHRNGLVNEDDDRIETSEEVEAWIREVESIPPLVFTTEEQARFDEWQVNHMKSEIEIVEKEFHSGVFYT